MFRRRGNITQKPQWMVSGDLRSSNIETCIPYDINLFRPILRSKAKVSGDSKVQYKAKEILTFKFNATEPGKLLMTFVEV